MTNDKKSKPKKKSTENKGVGITPNELELESLPSKISDDTEPHSPKGITVSNVREELKHVIETMGPNTATSSDAENETTYSTSEQSYILIQDLNSGNEINTLNFDSTEDNSELTNYNVSELVEYPAQTVDTSVQTSKREYLCPNVYNNNIPLHNFCPAHYMSQNEYIQQNNAETSNYTKHATFERVSRFATWLGFNNKNDKQVCQNCSKNCDFYKINIEHAQKDSSPPRRLVFDLMDELPKAETKTTGTNTKNQAFNVYKPTDDIHVQVNKAGTAKIKSQKKETVTERVDIYYFDHGNAEYYRTTDSPPVIKTEYFAERTDFYTKKLWGEFFGTFNIGVSFVISFILQLLRFILQAILRPLTIGVVQLISDYFFKPCLAVTFNGIVQPPMIFLYNFVTSVRDVCQPIADSMGYFIREASVMCKAIRLVHVESGKSTKPCCANVGSRGKNCGTE